MKIKPSVFGTTTAEIEDKDLAKVFSFISSNTPEQKAAIGAVISQLIDTAKIELDDPENVKAAANAMDFAITQSFSSLMTVLEDNPDFLNPFVEQVMPQIIEKIGETLLEMEQAPKDAITDFLGDILRKAQSPRQQSSHDDASSQSLTLDSPS